MDTTLLPSRTLTRHSTALAAASLLGLAVLLAPAPAQALRLPADPITFVPTPPALSRLIVSAQAANVRAALADLRSSQGD
jgi:hypothetical protein